MSRKARGSNQPQKPKPNQPGGKSAHEKAMDETERIRARRRAARNKLVGK